MISSMIFCNNLYDQLSMFNLLKVEYEFKLLKMVVGVAFNLNLSINRSGATCVPGRREQPNQCPRTLAYDRIQHSKRPDWVVYKI